ncbi:UPF0481 protein At3g47200-like [Cornus florida]|uniref:UPF0481 protein At3g47200-like n=1 Tax=Cornus florida TaxID=4283 RepID=UPI0028970FD9|nr:UPF0481 protein At3g47200-like [Cornus florida]
MEVIRVTVDQMVDEIFCSIVHVAAGYRSNDLRDWIETNNSMTLAGGPTNPVIESVPGVLRQEKGGAYTPSVVSIGPVHRGKLTSPEAIEESVKESTYMSSLFQRTGSNGGQTITKEGCEETLRPMANTLKACYPAVGQPEEDIVSIVTIDCCFIIELLYRHYTIQQRSDPILRDHLKSYAVRRDLLLLENQVPFSALEELFNLTVERFHPVEPTTAANRSQRRRPNISLTQCVLSFFGDMMGLKDGDISKKGGGSPIHILHLLHMCYKPWRIEHELGGGGVVIPRDQGHPCSYKPTAAQLKTAGVHLRKSERGNLFDLAFRSPFVINCRSGKLEIPRFSVSNITESFLRNLIAFEHCCPWVGSYFTSHALLIDILIDSVEDVKLFEEAKIIQNDLGSRDSVVQIFNGICRNADPHHFYYNKLFNTMEDFCTPQRAEMEIVKRNCAGNLWIKLSVFAASMLFFLTLLQTVYAMLSYHHPRKA